MKNKYVVRARISETKFKEILKYFSLDLQANQIAEISGLSRNSVNTYIKAMRLKIANEDLTTQNSVHATPLLFGLKTEDNKIVIDVIPQSLHTEIWKLLKSKKVIDMTHDFTGVIDIMHKKYYQINTPQSQKGQIQISETASFWGYSKIRLAKFRGISQKNIFLHLKECEFRYNHRKENLYKLMLSQFRKSPLVLH